MAKRSTIDESDQLLEISDEQVKLEEASVKIKLLRNVVYKYDSLSGGLITWNGAGSIVEVSREDADILLAKRRSTQCCGGTLRVTNIFEEVK